MKTWVQLLGVTGIGTALLGGCNAVEKLKKAGELAQQAASASVEAISSEEQKDGQLAEKLGRYIECLNGFSRDAFRTRNHYFKDVDRDKGPTGKERAVYVYALTYTPERCAQAIDKAKAAQPPLPEIEAAAIEYRKAMDALTPLAKMLHDYYDRKDFKDDQFAKGKEQHPKFVAAFDAFEKANKPLDEKVTVLNDQISQRQLERLKTRPERKMQYLIEKSVDDAKKLVKLVNVESIQALDGTAYNAALDAYEKSYTEMDNFATANPAEPGKVTMFSIYKSSAESLLKSAKELMRRKRDNQDFTKETGMPEHMEGHPAKVVKDFNQVIDRSNNLTYRR
jgi:hypothetical protein